MFIGLFCFNIMYIKIQLYLKKKKKKTLNISWT
jgi:hypothetical protein